MRDGGEVLHRITSVINAYVATLRVFCRIPHIAVIKNMQHLFKVLENILKNMVTLLVQNY